MTVLDNSGAAATVAPKRGSLKIFLGAAPGVGKTYAMLSEARGLQDEGRQVLIGIVEDHGRVQTKQMCEGLRELPLLPSRAGKGELDVAGVIAAKPQLVLVDEFAHSNPLGSRHPKRWGDVAEILNAGIDVFSTMNIQHLESLNDVVSQVTGITQKETVPDEVVRAAENIELVDIPPELLRTRLVEGRVYREDRIGPALNNYFRLGNLTALRELALLWLADQVDDTLTNYRNEQHITDTWETKERVVVAVQNATHAEPLIRRGRRIAAKSSAELIVVHVISGDTFITGSTATLARLQELSTDVGAKLHQVTGDNVPSALLGFARSVNATQLVLGASPRSRVARLFGETVSETVLRNSGRIDCHMVNLPPNRRRWGWVRDLLRPVGRNRLDAAGRWFLAIGAPALLTVILERSGGSELGTGTCSAFYFALILGISLISGVWTALISALLAGLALNWFFTPPLRTFDIAEPANAIVLVVMMATALAVGMLVQRARQARLRANAAAREAELLTVFSRATLEENAVDLLLQKVGEAFLSSAASVQDASGHVLASWQSPSRETEERKVETSVESRESRIKLILTGPAPSTTDRTLITVVADYLAGVYWQQHLTAEAARVDALNAANDLRRALLASVSHDLRTPLATAKLAISSLRSPEVDFGPEDTKELMAGVEESIDQLTTLVTNLLDSSRLSAGAVTARRDEVDISEVIHRAVASISLGKPSSTIRRIKVDRSTRGVQCIGDAGLLERVVANLLDNALRYSTGLVGVTAKTGPDEIELSVSDTGPGIDKELHDKVFRPFQRLGDRNNDNGVGLGLAVVRGFVEAMGGSINIDDGPGATFRLRLPAKGIVDGKDSSR